ncbi:MAG: exopolysaccharide biosynthesis polyprenyl glycosylphosphotransferase [Acetobacteraceae bacterium]|nr:exopolysaccharide biosynthesis polyprenyl glycosylphosphotransferase [Acetobacteraceae bacterium]
MTASRAMVTLHNHTVKITQTRRSTWEAQAMSFVVFDLLAFAAAAAAAAVIVGLVEGFDARSVFDRSVDNVGTMRSAWHGWGVILVLLITLAQLRGRGHYSQRIPFWTAARDVISASVLALICDLILSTKIYGVPFEAEQALRWVLFACLILVFRSAAAGLLSRLGLWTLRTLVIGPDEDLARVASALRSEPGLGFSIVGTLARPLTSGGASFRRWQELVVGRGADYVALVADPADPAGDARIVAALNRAHVPFALVHALSALPVRMARPHYFMSHDIVVMAAESALANPFKRAIKRGFDIVVASILLATLSSMMLAITIMVRRGGGPALYRHKRIGFEGRTFGCIKFRSMAVDGDRILAELLANDPEAAAEWAATQKLRNDPRVTPIGRFLRNTSLDELPQLLNVIRGEMSLVGPRPVVQSELGFYGENAEYYMQTRPGLTGLWQVSGRSDTTYAQRVRLDVWYVRNWTLWHDLAILMKTIPVVLFRRGAV